MWPGGKDGAGIAQRLINEIPPHDLFISPFLGDCAVMRRKRPAARSIGIDLDRANIERWAATADVPGLELLCCDGIEWLRFAFGFYRVGAAAGNGDGRSTAAESSGPDRAAGNGDPRVLRRVSQRPSRSGTASPNPAAAVAGNGDGDGERRQRSHDSASGSAAAGNGDDAGRVARFGDGTRWPSPPISAASAEAARFGGWARTFAYVDPPYLMHTRRSPRKLYAHELDEQGHAKLLATLVAAPCLVMVSHYPCELYQQKLAGWRSFTFAAQTRGSRVTEQVWCNYPPPAELHDPRYLGRDKRQRERIRRRVRNWAAGVRRMPALERQAVIEAIVSGEC